jgi:hypothetical protein
MEIRVTLTMECEKWTTPKLVGGIVLQSGMTVAQIKRMVAESSHLIEQRLVDNELLGVL